VELIQLTANGLPKQVAVREDETLLEVLRREFDLNGVREACGIGVCGSCTVLVHGRSVTSCLVLAPFADGLEVETVEALGTLDALHPIQQAFVEHSAFQCSYCTPGFVLATKALLAENPDPTPDDVREGLAGNICRCGSYQNILAAVLDAAARLREDGARAAAPETAPEGATSA
jgi:aerobic-type carbon monoxide dehydrogenase small subunit (CoxS/CutS family)